MDTTTAIVLLVILFALIIVAAFLVFRQRGQVKIDTPLGKLDLEASNEPLPPQAAIKAEDIKSHGGGLLADDETGRGLDVKRVEVQDDVLLSSKPPDPDPDPKADPPA
jgi:hypothetical protein